jgi:hypothetical protein
VTRTIDMAIDMANDSPLVNIDRGSRSRSEIEVARKKLDTLGQTIKEKRLALARQPPGVLPEGDWEDMLRAHQAIQQNIESTGTVTDQLIEGLRFDLDIPKHAFGRWVFRVDQRF